MQTHKSRRVGGVVLTLLVLLSTSVLPVYATTNDAQTRLQTQANETQNPPAEPNTSAPSTNASAPTNNSTNTTGPCAGLGTVEGAVCAGFQDGFGAVVEGTLDWLGDKLLTSLQNAAETFIEVLVSRPVPLRNGEMELTQRPTNPPMGAVYDLWLNVGLPGGIAVWALMMLVMRLSALLPSQLVPTAQSRTQQLKGWFALFRMLTSWIWCALLLHLTLGIAVWFAPRGDQIFTSFESVAETAVTGGITALLVYLSSGILFVLVVLVFGLSFVAPFVLMPAYPLFIALSIPDFWIFEWVAEKGETLRALFAPAAFMPIPTAIILGSGYPVLEAIRGSMAGPIASIAGVPIYVVLLLVMWIAALLVPLLLFLGTWKTRSLGSVAAGAIGAATAVGVSRGAGGLRGRLGNANAAGAGAGTSSTATPSADGSGAYSGGSRSVDPLQGSPFSRETTGGFGRKPTASPSENLALNSGSRAIREQVGEPGSVAPATKSGIQTGRSANNSRGTATENRNPGLENVPDDEEIVHVSSWNQLDESQEYAAGFYNSKGSLQRTDNGSSSPADWLERSAHPRMSAAKSNETVILRGEEDGRIYDVRDADRSGMSPQEQQRDSSRVVEETRRL